MWTPLEGVGDGDGVVQSASGRTSKRTTGIMYVHLGTWPSWVNLTFFCAAANAMIDFYYIGQQLHVPQYCQNCHAMLMDEESLRARLKQHAGVDTRRVRSFQLSAKVKDYKPLFPAMFPELTARHRWIGTAEVDVLFGNLASEVKRLNHDEDELLVPQGYFPHPLANGQLVILRTSEKMIMAFKRLSGWKLALESPARLVFDEYWGAPSMFDVYHQMSLDGILVARPTRMPLVQDMVVMATDVPGFHDGRSFPSHIAIDENASVDFVWHGDRLWGRRDGPCLCGLDVWLATQPLVQGPLTSCAACARRSHAMDRATSLPSVNVAREREVLGIHWQVWKRRLDLGIALDRAQACAQLGRVQQTRIHVRAHQRGAGASGISTSHADDAAKVAIRVHCPDRTRL